MMKNHISMELIKANLELKYNSIVYSKSLVLEKKYPLIHHTNEKIMSLNLLRGNAVANPTSEQIINLWQLYEGEGEYYDDAVQVVVE